MTILRQRGDTPNVAEIITAVSALSLVPRDLILGRSRLKPISNARKVVYHLGRKYGHSTPAIAHRMGGIDHTSVVKGSAAAVEFMGRFPQFATLVAETEQRALQLAADRHAQVAASVPLALRIAA